MVTYPDGIGMPSQAGSLIRYRVCPRNCPNFFDEKGNKKESSGSGDIHSTEVQKANHWPGPDRPCFSNPVPSTGALTTT